MLQAISQSPNFRIGKPGAFLYLTLILLHIVDWLHIPIQIEGNEHELENLCGRIVSQVFEGVANGGDAVRNNSLDLKSILQKILDGLKIPQVEGRNEGIINFHFHEHYVKHVLIANLANLFLTILQWYMFIGLGKLLNLFAHFTDFNEFIEVVHFDVVQVVHEVLVREDEFEHCAFGFFQHFQIFIKINLIFMKESKRVVKVERFSSIENKKNVTVTKCFICNQVFYSNKLFQSHMKDHQSKINRNNPDQIQRKTMQSFRMKKTTNSKFQLPSTKTLPNKTTIEQIPSTQQSLQLKSKQENQEFQQTEQAMRESLILIKEIQIFTTNKAFDKEEKPKKREINEGQREVEEEEKIEEKEFYAKLKFVKNDKEVEKLVERTNFQTSILISYQEQLKYLQQIAKIDSSLCSKKWKQVKNNLLSTIKEASEEIFQNSAQMTASRYEGKATIEIRENSKVTICAECCSEVQFEEQYYYLSCGHEYHLQCWDRESRCCS